MGSWVGKRRDFDEIGPDLVEASDGGLQLREVLGIGRHWRRAEVAPGERAREREVRERENETRAFASLYEADG